MSTVGDKRIFKAVVMNPVSPGRVERFNPGYLIISGKSVQELTHDDPTFRVGPAQFTDLGTRTIVPGFIDTHVHLPQFPIMGIGTGELLDWLRNYPYPEEARFADPQTRR